MAAEKSSTASAGRGGIEGRRGGLRDSREEKKQMEEKEGRVHRLRVHPYWQRQRQRLVMQPSLAGRQLRVCPDQAAGRVQPKQRRASQLPSPHP
jgi:hypothetical protein